MRSKRPGAAVLGVERKVHYTVTYTGTPAAKSGIAAHPVQNLEAALRLAHQFLKERRPDVTSRTRKVTPFLVLIWRSAVVAKEADGRSSRFFNGLL